MNSIKREIVPSVETMMAWTTEIFNQGIRRAGYPADYWAENWVKEKFEAFGLQDVTLDPVPILMWEARDASLKIWLMEDPDVVIDIPCFPVAYTLPTKGVEGELYVISDDLETSGEGKIAMSNLTLSDLPIKMLMALSGADRVYDPKNEFESFEQKIPMDMTFLSGFDPILESKALGYSGYIGILAGHPWDTCEYYFPYDAVERKIPGVWVSPNSGKKISSLMEKGMVRGRISYDGGISEIKSHNIMGSLPGMSEDWVVIGTHHDGPFESAVEDASGMALVLAQAKYWSQIPKEQRPYNLKFLMTCAHMAGIAPGTQAFVNRNKDFIQKIVTAFHLEHVARDVKIENGKYVNLDEPTPRWWFTSRILPLEEIAEEAITKEDLQRSVFLPEELLPGKYEGIPTDGNPYIPAKVPVISLVTTPTYLLDSSDTLDKVHQESFEPLTRAVIRIINALKSNGHTAEGLRNQFLTRRERKRKRKRELQSTTK